MCQSTNVIVLVAGVYMSSLSISGTLPPCLGHLNNMSIFLISRNYLESSIPESFNSLTNLQSFFVSSNRLTCTSPRLDSATHLGKGRYKGVVYAAQTKMVNRLQTEAQINSATFNSFFSSLLPKASNTVLIYTGFEQYLSMS